MFKGVQFAAGQLFVRSDLNAAPLRNRFATSSHRALFASWIPAQRTSRVNPVVAFRAE
jgi:ABC-type lipoprotein release transport system permease subunit